MQSTQRPYTAKLYHIIVWTCLNYFKRDKQSAAILLGPARYLDVTENSCKAKIILELFSPRWALALHRIRFNSLKIHKTKQHHKLSPQLLKT